MWQFFITYFSFLHFSRSIPKIQSSSVTAFYEIKHPLKNTANEALNKITKNNSCLVDPFEKALIPRGYITNTNERLKIYGFIEKKSAEGKFNQIVFELEDRFGKIPKDLKNLIHVMKIKKTGSVLGIDKITIKKVCLVFVFFNTKNSSHEKQKTFIAFYLASSGFIVCILYKKTKNPLLGYF